MFGRKKIEKPKNPLGIVLYEYDLILNTELKDILSAIKNNKRLNPLRTGRVFKSVSSKFDSLAADISKEKLKIDYRSDKARELIIEMMANNKESFRKMIDQNFNLYGQDLKEVYAEFEIAFRQRDLIRKKLKDVECDYV